MIVKKAWVAGVVFLVIVSAGFFVLAAPPEILMEKEFPRPALVRGADLTVLWADPAHAPRAFAWTDYWAHSDSRKPIFPEKGAEDAVIPRAGFGKLPATLWVVPMDDRLRPLVFEVPSGQNEIVLRFDPIEQHEVWFWGITPDDPCSTGHIRIRAHDVSDRSVRANLNGFFFWKLVLSPADKDEKAVYFFPDYHDAVAAVRVEGCKKANDISTALCHAYYGGSCDLNIETNSRVRGRLHQIHFEMNKGFDRYRGCPI